MNIFINIDQSVANFFYISRNIELIKIFTIITFFGEWQIVAGMAIIFSFILLLYKKKMYILSLWITLIGSGIFSSIGKLIFHRLRPDTAFYIEDSFSFPSGHATIAIAFYGFVIFFLCQMIKKREYKICILFLGLILIFAIGFSRLYLGVHFLSDVCAGYFLGAFWLFVGIIILKWLQHRKV
ncbi:MAG: phosphatase PAP2 family protein [Patescibacteria group bacterium]